MVPLFFDATGIRLQPLGLPQQRGGWNSMAMVQRLFTGLWFGEWSGQAVVLAADRREPSKVQAGVKEGVR